MCFMRLKTHWFSLISRRTNFLWSCHFCENQIQPFRRLDLCEVSIFGTQSFALPYINNRECWSACKGLIGVNTNELWRDAGRRRAILMGTSSRRHKVKYCIWPLEWNARYMWHESNLFLDRHILSSCLVVRCVRWSFRCVRCLRPNCCFWKERRLGIVGANISLYLARRGVSKHWIWKISHTK